MSISHFQLQATVAFNRQTKQLDLLKVLLQIMIKYITRVKYVYIITRLNMITQLNNIEVSVSNHSRTRSIHYEIQHKTPFQTIERVTAALMTSTILMTSSLPQYY